MDFSFSALISNFAFSTISCVLAFVISIASCVFCSDVSYASLTIFPASSSKFWASTSRGLKVGHTNSNGNPYSVFYPASLSLTSTLLADFDGSGMVDMFDFAILGSQWQQGPGDPNADIDPIGGDGIVDYNDLEILKQEWLM